MYQSDYQPRTRSTHHSSLSPTVPIFRRHFNPQVYTEDLYACTDAGGAPVSGRAAGFLLDASLLFWLAVLLLVAWSVRQPAGEASVTASPEAAESRYSYPGGTLIFVLADLMACDPHICGDPHPRAFESDLAHRSLKKAIQHPTLHSQCGQIFLIRSVRGRQTWVNPCRWYGLGRA